VKMWKRFFATGTRENAPTAAMPFGVSSFSGTFTPNVLSMELDRIESDLGLFASIGLISLARRRFQHNWSRFSSVLMIIKFSQLLSVRFL
jgi:hypothetical protein